MAKYDIFMSYRRDGGAQYARILQLMLHQRGYKVFLDYDELTDGVFGENIKKAIKEAPVFMLVLSEKSMLRCVNEDDWLRQEILLAIKEGKHLVPINPDNKFDGIPSDSDDKVIPKEIRENIYYHQHSEIGFGQTLGVTIDLMIRNRLIPTLGERIPTGHIDNDLITAQETLKKIDKRNRFMKRLCIAGVMTMILIILSFGLIFWHQQIMKEQREREMVELAKMKDDLQEKYKSFGLNLSPNLTVKQMSTIDTLLQNMKWVRPDTLSISQYEFSIGQWHGILDETYDETKRNLPMTNVSFGEVAWFLIKLSDMTNLDVALPSAEEWEYAAHGGFYKETTLYVGDDDANKVAWYKDNSKGRIHPSDGQQGKDPNMLDLFDMSGNVSELCNTAYNAGDNAQYTICGGNYNSPKSEITTKSRTGFSTNAKDKAVGFRIVIRKN